MRPYGKDRKLRKELFKVPRKELDDSRQKSDILLQQLQQMKQQQAAQAPSRGSGAAATALGFDMLAARWW